MTLSDHPTMKKGDLIQFPEDTMLDGELIPAGRYGLIMKRFWFFEGYYYLFVISNQRVSLHRGHRGEFPRACHVVVERTKPRLSNLSRRLFRDSRQSRDPMWSCFLFSVSTTNHNLFDLSQHSIIVS